MLRGNTRPGGEMMRMIGAVLLALFLVGCSKRFSDQDIENLKTTVRAEFEKREGVKVSEVSFITESPTKLKGFVRLKVGEIDVTKNCSATLGEEGRYIWECP